MKFSKKMSLISLLIFSIQIHGACLFTGSGDTYLHLAVNRDDYADVQQLLPAEARSIDKENNKGETPLHVACNRQKPIFEVVQCLVDTYRKNNNIL